jgi:ketosteroid isomerase-like protein
MSIDPRRAVAFVETYGRAWESWDEEAFVQMFTEDIVYIAHPDEIVHGRQALSMGTVSLPSSGSGRPTMERRRRSPAA